MMQCVSVVSLFSFIFLHSIKTSSECESNAALWTYYPCSFIISPISFSCSSISINSSIDQCINKEMTFFWHFPFGNMTLILQSERNQSFSLDLSKTLFSRNELIKNIYHFVNNKTAEEQLLLLSNNHTNEMIRLYSDEYHQCSMQFETTNPNIFDYGTFIRMTVLIL